MVLSKKCIKPAIKVEEVAPPILNVKYRNDGRFKRRLALFEGVWECSFWDVTLCQIIGKEPTSVQIVRNY